MLALATAEEKLIDHVDISQVFLQGDLLEEEGFEGDVFISPPPGYGEDAKFVYRLCAPLLGACTSSWAWHTTMSAFMERQGFKTVGFEKSMWCHHDSNGDKIMVGSHVTISAYAAQTALASTNLDWRCSTLPKADSLHIRRTSAPLFKTSHRT